MRNNTKLKELLKINDLHLKMNDDDKIELMVFNKFEKTSFVVDGKSISDVFTKALKFHKKGK